MWMTHEDQNVANIGSNMLVHMCIRLFLAIVFKLPSFGPHNSCQGSWHVNPPDCLFFQKLVLKITLVLTEIFRFEQHEV